MPNLLDALSDSENTIDLHDENLITPIHEFLEINPEKRLITIPESEQLFGVYGENKVEIKYFKCPRIILNDIDLYECYIFINYISASGKVGYIQADTVVLDETESYIIFTWELTRNVFDENIDTDIYFSISAKQYLEDKEPVFFTRKAKGNLYETVYAEEQITEQYADIILQLLANNETKVDLPVDEEGNLLVPKEGQTLLFREDGTTYYGTISVEGGTSFSVSAEDVTYDDTETEIGATNVQDAFGKLSATCTDLHTNDDIFLKHIVLSDSEEDETLLMTGEIDRLGIMSDTLMNYAETFSNSENVSISEDGSINFNTPGIYKLNVAMTIENVYSGFDLNISLNGELFNNHFVAKQGTHTYEFDKVVLISRPTTEKLFITDMSSEYLAEITNSVLRVSEPAFIGKVSNEQIEQVVEDYLAENQIECGATAEQLAQIEQNKKDIGKLSATIADLKENGTGSGTVVSSVEPMEDDIPKVFFSEAIPQTKDDATTAFRYISKTQDISGFAEFKAQGNSSMSYPKKNMTVKMYSDEALTEKLKVNFKEWGEQAKHVYKANWIDLTHARNIVSARLWADVVKSRANYSELPELLRTSPNQGAVDGFPVKVYSQGIYQGRYTLNIPKDAWMSNMDDALDNHCILCGENYVSGCFRATANINGNDWTDEVHDTVPTSIKTRWNEVISFVMNSTDEEFVANLENYFFVDSLIDYFIFGMVSCGLDAFGKNQIYMTYDGVRWIASMYDMDSTWGLYWNGSKFVSANYSRESFEDFVSTQSSGQGNLLYIRLANLFCDKIQFRYEELKQGALSIPNIINRFERFTDIASLDLVKEDYASTTADGKFTGIPSQSTNNIQQIRKFVIDRFAYCDEYFASLVPTIPIPATSITLDKASLTFTDASTQTITATVEPSDTTDVIVWSSDNEEVAKVENGVVTPIAKGSCIITATCGSVSATCSVTVDIEEIVTYTITRNLTKCTSSSAITSINEGSAHIETITADRGYTLDGATVSITMGGVDISSSFVDGVLTIGSVTGDILIEVSAVLMSTDPLYPFTNGTRIFNGGTLTITNGNHIAYEQTAGWKQFCVGLYDIELTDKELHGKASCDTERFTLKTGDVVRFVKSNVKYENGVYDDGTVCDVEQIDSAVSLYKTDDTEVKVVGNHKLSAGFDALYNVTNDLSIANLQFWKTNSGAFKVEYDIELYVNDIRYI